MWVFENGWDDMVVLVLILNLWTASLYGTYQDDYLIDFLLALFAFMYFCELWLRVFTFGWSAFWYVRLPKNAADTF